MFMSSTNRCKSWLLVLSILAMTCSNRDDVMEARRVIVSICLAQETHLAEHGNFLPVSESPNDWFPSHSTGTKQSWNGSAHPRAARWRKLLPAMFKSNAATTASFTVVAGSAATHPPKVPTSWQPKWPSPLPAHWYLIVASFRTSDGDMSCVIASSLTGDKHVARCLP